jgi:UDP-3-O-[3-hydroxymyristoyl] glucosamine N-acyltransferase
MNNMETSINYAMIHDFLGDHIVKGNHELIVFKNIKSISQGNKDSLVFISKGMKDKERFMLETDAVCIIIDKDDITLSLANKVLILVDDPKIVFSKIGNHFFVPTIEYSIHQSAIIHPEAQIANDVYIGPNCVIGKGVIGSQSILYGNIFVYDNYSIGKNVKINPGVVIGAEGFGYNKDENGIPIQFPHIGGVVIEDNVEIGSNTCIDRGALDNTIIKKGAKIDNLVHIAHNVNIGEYAYVIANAMIGGSTSIGNNTYIAPSVSVKDQLKIGNNALIGMASSVLKNIPSNEIWTGSPAQPFEKIKLLNEKLKNL